MHQPRVDVAVTSAQPRQPTQAAAHRYCHAGQVPHGFVSSGESSPSSSPWAPHHLTLISEYLFRSFLTLCLSIPTAAHQQLQVPRASPLLGGWRKQLQPGRRVGLGGCAASKPAPKHTARATKKSLGKVRCEGMNQFIPQEIELEHTAHAGTLQGAASLCPSPSEFQGTELILWIPNQSSKEPQIPIPNQLQAP